MWLLLPVSSTQISSNQQTDDSEIAFDEQALAWFAQGEQPNALELSELNGEPSAPSRANQWAAASVMLALALIALLVV